MKRRYKVKVRGLVPDSAVERISLAHAGAASQFPDGSKVLNGAIQDPTPPPEVKDRSTEPVEGSP